MKTNILFILILLISVVFSSCKKYEDGPVISFRSVKKRISGTWQATRQVVNSYEYLNNYQITFNQLEDSKDPEGKYNTYTLYTSDSSNAQEKYSGSWEMSADKKKIFLYGSILEYNYGNGWNTVNNNFSEEWNILRLKKKEMRIECQITGNSYYVEFIKI